MKLTHDDIEEFKQIYRDEFGEELSDADAEARARQLLSLVDIVYRVLVNDRRSQPETSCPHVDEPDRIHTVNNTGRGQAPRLPSRDVEVS